MKRLIVCCDGTWNNADQEDNGIPAPTNVVKIYNAIADEDASNSIAQLKYYHPGVGGEGGFFDSITGGAVGVGIGRNICSAYHWLGTNYEEGDEIYLFGFSRGAFTARSLGGFLQRGLLNLQDLEPSESWHRVHTAYKEGYQVKDAKQEDWAGNWPFFNQKEDGEKNKPTPIHFIGVWDTVGSLGVPDDLEILNLLDNKNKWQFHNTKLGDHVKTARHAMALDEVRSSFSVTRWDKKPGADLKEVWFPGVHSNVGGGYADCGLSNGALIWMMEESEKAGLKFRDNVIGNITADPLAVLHNSYKGVFAKFRSRPRNIDAMIPANQDLFHSSAMVRQRISPIAYPLYHPTRILKEGEEYTVEIFANKHWNYTGLYLKSGQKFIFSAKGQWQDSKDSCDWQGAENNELTMGDIVRGFSSFFGKFEPILKNVTGNQLMDIWGTKRVESINWFAMVGAIANDSGSSDVVKNDGSPRPHQYVDLYQHADLSSSLLIDQPGYLYCFANDAWSLYENNRGSIRLTITCTKSE